MPKLTIIAGCNGAGKSTYASSLLPDDITSFDNLLLIDNSTTNKIYSNILQIENGLIELMTNQIPDYFERRFPSIYELINKG